MSTETEHNTTCTAVGEGGWLADTDGRCELPLGHEGNEHRKGAVVWHGSTKADDTEYLHELLYQAWGVIANAGGWPSSGGASPGWLEAAERWRDEWHVVLRSHCTHDETAQSGR